MYNDCFVNQFCWESVGSSWVSNLIWIKDYKVIKFPDKNDKLLYYIDVPNRVHSHVKMFWNPCKFFSPAQKHTGLTGLKKFHPTQTISDMPLSSIHVQMHDPKTHKPKIKLVCMTLMACPSIGPKWFLTAGPNHFGQVQIWLIWIDF